MAGTRIFEAAWMVKDSHQACNLAIQRIFDDQSVQRPENCGGDARV